jgi:hypothetical protein
MNSYIEEIESGRQGLPAWVSGRRGRRYIKPESESGGLHGVLAATRRVCVITSCESPSRGDHTPGKKAQESRPDSETSIEVHSVWLSASISDVGSGWNILGRRPKARSNAISFLVS